MARSHGAGRGTSFHRGLLSGATVVTFPSGTTTTKGSLQTAGGITASGEVRGTQFYDTTTSGYPISYASSGKIIGAGTCSAGTAGEVTPSAAAMGLTTIDVVVASASTAEAAITPLYISFDRGGGNPWQSGTTQVHFSVWSGAHGGTGLTTFPGVSIHYIAVGS